MATETWHFTLERMWHDRPVSGERPTMRPAALSARGRIVGWVVLLVGLALGASVAVSWQILLVGIDRRVDAELAHEAEKLRSFASSATDPLTGRPYDRVDALLERYLQVTLPQADGEAFFSILEGRPHRRSLGDPPARVDTDPALVAEIAGITEPTYGWTTSDAGAVRYAALPVRVAGDERQAALVVLEFSDLQRQEVTDAVRVVAVVGFAALGLAALAGWLVAGRVLEPVRLVRQTAEQIGESDLSQRIAVEGNDDVAQLARTFNHMLDRLSAAFATQRHFLDDAGHELRTPITVIRGHLELMGDDPTERQETLALLTSELDRMGRIVDDLLLLAKAEQPDFLTVAPVDVAELTVDLVAKARALGSRRWTVAEVAETTILADGQRLTQALMQLVANAVQHTSDGDGIAVGSASTPDRVRLWVSDTGSGIATEDRARLFERFARGDGARRSEGAGLGLAIVRSITEAHGGVVHVESEVGRGATFTLDLPARPVRTVAEAVS
jgi:signal transduction histidine kinase